MQVSDGFRWGSSRELLAAELVVTPLIVWLATSIQRRQGGLLAGMLAGFPVMTAPVAVFMAREQGPEFAARSALAILLALPGATLLALVFLRIAARAAWAAALPASRATCFAARLVCAHLDPGLLTAALLASASLPPRSP